MWAAAMICACEATLDQRGHRRMADLGDLFDVFESTPLDP